jgi:hypothetical protein
MDEKIKTILTQISDEENKLSVEEKIVLYNKLEEIVNELNLAVEDFLKD